MFAKVVTYRKDAIPASFENFSVLGKKKQLPIKSLIAQRTRIGGHVTLQDGLRVNGEVVGDIRVIKGAPSILVVSEQANVCRQIHAGHIIINSHIRGPVHALTLLELQSKAQVEGDVFCKALEMHRGATTEGRPKPMDAAQRRKTNPH